MRVSHGVVQIVTSTALRRNFPLDWQGTPAANSQGVQFTNPTMPNVYAAFKTPGATGDAPTNVLMNDVQTTFGSQPDYAAPTPPPTANATIGGAPWYAIATNYNDNQNQPIHVEVYATVYQGKAYIIELQAPQSNDQFDSGETAVLCKHARQVPIPANCSIVEWRNE